MNRPDRIKANPFERSQPLTQDFFDIPLLGMVRLDSDSYPTGNYSLDELITNFKKTAQHTVTLEVLDNAMIQAGIAKGDYLTIDLRTKPLDGNIVVFKLGERFYIRRFFHQHPFIRLETDSDYSSSLIIDTNTPDFFLLGKVISLSRKF
jgi:SOS-response transcriptional repressor LexA